MPHDDLEGLCRNAKIDQSLSTAATNVVGTREFLPLSSAFVLMLNNHTSSLSYPTNDPTDSFDR